MRWSLWHKWLRENHERAKEIYDFSYLCNLELMADNSLRIKNPYATTACGGAVGCSESIIFKSLWHQWLRENHERAKEIYDFSYLCNLELMADNSHGSTRRRGGAAGGRGWVASSSCTGGGD